MLQLHFPSSIVSYIEDKNSALTAQAILNHAWTAARNAKGNDTESSSDTAMKVRCCVFALILQLSDAPQTIFFPPFFLLRKNTVLLL